MTRRRLHTRLHLAAGAVALLALGACDDDPAAPDATGDQAIAADLAASAGTGVASDVAVWMGDEAAASGSLAGAGAPPGGSCTQDGNTRSCTGGREGTLTVTRSVTYRDAAGAAMPAYDAAATASIDFATTISGSISGTGPRGSMTGTVNRQRAHTVSGLAGSETQRTWNGTGAGTVSTTFTGERGSRQHDVTEADTTTNVTWVVAPTRAQWPASGTVVRSMLARTTFTGERTGTVTSRRRAVVTFNGTSQVPLVISLVTPRGVQREATCTLDLAARTVTCARDGA